MFTLLYPPKTQFYYLNMYLRIPEINADREKSGKDNTEKNVRTSFMFSNINSDEKSFLEHVAKGDVDKVKRVLESDPKFNINCLDFQGNSALQIALEKNNEKMVEFLLKRKQLDVRDCAFHAIKLNQPKNLVLILDKVKRSYPKYNLEFEPCVESSDFPDYLTPLMLAAQCGHVEIINLLLDRGHPELKTPHQATCVCDECLSTLKDKDPLELVSYKLALFRAICNPAYICQSTTDPILLVFHLVIELRRMAAKNRVFLRKYEELIEETEKFAADLVGLCRTSDEVRVILNERDGSNLDGNFLFPRLILAVDYKQKYFVAQTNVQEVLENAWVGNWYDWRGYSDARRCISFVGRILMLPLVYIICIFLPRSSWARFYSIPLNRMISSVASYFIFLGLLYTESNRDKQGQTRYDIQYHTGWQVLIFIFVVSHILSSVRMWSLQGTKRYFSFKWNIYDIATELMFVLTFSFWISALVTMGWQPDIERKYWHYLDPQLLAEGFFCIGTVMAFSRLLLLVQINNKLGPMQVSLGKMTSDFSQFIVIFAIVVGSFTAGLCRLYQYYDGMKQVDPDTKAVSRQESSFVSAYDTFKVLFWGLFCMSSQEAGDVIIENLPSEEGELEIINNHDFTQSVGYALFGVYTVLTVIVLLNMLIAAMSNTFQRVTENVDIEWIFGRTEVYLAYMSQTVMPPPFSFIPAGVGVSACSGFFSTMCKWCATQELLDAEQPKLAEFEDVVQRLVQRYFT